MAAKLHEAASQRQAACVGKPVTVPAGQQGRAAGQQDEGLLQARGGVSADFDVSCEVRWPAD